MGSMSDYYELIVLDTMTGKNPSTTRYIALCTAAPTDASTGTTITEPSGQNYGRKSTAASDWNSASAGSTSNAATITFATPSGSWGTCTHWALCDAATVGNVLCWGALGSSMGIGANAVVSFAAGAITVTLD